MGDGEQGAESELSDNPEKDAHRMLYYLRRSSIHSVLCNRTKKQSMRRLREELTKPASKTSPHYDVANNHLTMCDLAHQFFRGGHLKMHYDAYNKFMAALKA